MDMARRGLKTAEYTKGKCVLAIWLEDLTEITDN